jgi:CubicO group peptidase (beta-lactamase class C family)
MQRNAAWTVAPGYDPVADRFVDLAALLGKGGGAFTVLHGGRPVVDLWGGDARPGQPWEEDTLGILMSVTKGLAGLCLMILVDRGELSLDDLVTDHWPEYGQAGKERTTVEMVMMHTAGALGLPDHQSLLSWDGTGWDRYDEIAARLAAAPPAWEPGTKQGYHALTYGWLVGELVRRITGRTLGRYFHDEVAVPLGLDTYIGTPPEALPRVARLTDMSYHAIPGALRSTFTSTLAATRDPDTLNGTVFMATGTTSAVEQLADGLSTDALLSAEFASGNGTSTTRSLARAFALMGAGGELDGVRLVSDKTMAAFAGVRSSLPDELAREIATTKAQKKMAEKPVLRVGPYLANSSPGPGMPNMMGPNLSAAGAAGFGGQIVFFDRDHDLAVAYVRNHLVPVDVLCPALVETTYDCAARVGHVDGSTLPKRSLGQRLSQPVLRRYLERLQKKSLEPAKE